MSVGSHARLALGEDRRESHEKKPLLMELLRKIEQLYNHMPHESM